MQRFTLHANRELALQRGVEVQIQVSAGDGLRVGTPIRFKGLSVGMVERVELTEDVQAVRLTARITQASAHIARAGSQFWVVKPELALARTANLDTLISGPYVQVRPAAKGGAAQTRFTAALNQAPIASTCEPGLHLLLSAPRRSSLKPGVQVSYREIPVGKVTHIELGPTSNRVLVHLLIEPRYAPLVRSTSKFWNASGIGVDASLFKGVKVRTESLEALLEGGIAFATPNNPQMGGPAQPGKVFSLHEEANQEWLNWAPKIVLKK